MVPKDKNVGTVEGKKKVKVDKLDLNKETVKDLTDDESKQVKGGVYKSPVKLAPTNTAGCTAPSVCGCA